MAVYERNPNTGVETIVAGIQDLSVYESRISNIEDVIPSGASSSNQLVDEDSLGTASAKDYTDNVAPNNHNLVESNAVYSAIASAISAIYKPQGNLSCAELTSALLIASNVGNVYNMTDSGITSDLFVQGAGTTINVNDTVGIIQTGVSEYKFNYMGNLIDLHNYQTKALDTPLTIDGTQQTTVEGALGALSTNKATQAEVNGIVNVLGAKNFINNTSVSATDGNVQYTVNSDKSISINILSALSANTGRIVGYINVKAGLTYILTGGVSNKVRVDFRNSDYSMWTDNAQSKEVTSPKQSYSVDTFTPNNDATLMVYIRIDSSTATGNAGTVYPMLRLASDPDNTYQPYAKTNKELTDGLVYSTSETKTGATWIDGKPIYRKAFGYTSVVTTGNSAMIGTIDNMADIINIQGTFRNNNDNNCFPIGYTFSNNSGLTAQNFPFVLHANGEMYANAYGFDIKNINVVVEYTKTT